MSPTRQASRTGSVSRALAADRLGVPAVLSFVLAGVAPLTVAAGVIPTAYATTGLTGIPAAFLAVAVILAVFSAGYVTMTRHVTNAGAFYKPHLFAATCVRRRRNITGSVWVRLAGRRVPLWEPAVIDVVGEVVGGCLGVDPECGRD
jgi:hypothetical protein